MKPILREKLDAVVFSYFLGINLQVPYCILDDRFARFVDNCDLVQQTVNRDIVQLLTHSNLPIIRPSTINYRFIFSIYLSPIFQRNHRRKRWLRLALFYDTNKLHTEFTKRKSNSLSVSANDHDLKSSRFVFLWPTGRDYDLIIGNLTPSCRKNLFHYADINLTSNDLAFIARQVQEKGIRMLQERQEEN